MTRLAGRGPGPKAKFKKRVTNWHRNHPPECPPGCVTGPPDYIGVGCQKSGTSWWYSLILKHPQVSDLVRPKELRIALRIRADRDAAAAFYYRHFPRRPGTIAGEFTPEYILPPGPRLLHSVAPNAKILVIMRDPVARFESGVTMDSHREKRLTLQQLAAQETRSRYGELVEELLQQYDREQVLFLQFERCTADTPGQLARTFEFLGLDPIPTPTSADQVVNRTRTKKFTLTPEERSDLAARLAPDLTRLFELLPDDIDPALWPTAAALNSRQ